MSSWSLGVGTITQAAIDLSIHRVGAMGYELVSTEPIYGEIVSGNQPLTIGYCSKILGVDEVGVAYIEEVTPAEPWFDDAGSA